MAERKALEPKITVNISDNQEQVVKVGPLSWGGVKDLLDAVAKADLPMPNLAGLDLLGDNMQVIYQWVIKHPPIVAALVRGATGLQDEHIDQLSAGQFVRVTRAAWNALSEDGFVEELQGFFAELLPMTKGAISAIPNQQNPTSQNAEPASTADSASESKSESAPSPAGA